METNGYNLSNDTSICQFNGSNEATFIDELTNVVLSIYPWLMILFGTISNSITFIVLTRPKLRKSSTFFYLSCLSIIDLVLLYTFCINLVFYHNFNINLQLVNLSYCKLHSFLIYFLPQFSAWTCVAVSLDRVIGVIFSVRGRHAGTAKKWNTPKKAIKVMMVIFICLFFLNSHFFFYPNYVQDIDEEIKSKDVNLIYCSLEHSQEEHLKKMYLVWVHIDLSVNVLVPFAIMIISSVIIVYGIFSSTKNLAHTLAQDTSKFDGDRRNSCPQFRQKTSNSSNIPSDPLVLKPRKSINFIKRASTAFSTSVSAKARSVSYMLATNNIVFISLTLPIVVYLSVTSPINEIKCDYEKSKMRLIKVICIILMNSNCTVNIFIYSFMASEFRHQLFEIVDGVIFNLFGHKSKCLPSRISLKSDLKSMRQNSSADYPDSHSKRASSSK